ncbi:YjfB family protein [Amphibacillus sediminis]|uniref:YjfB family protein n=1 Tax=Amphibacillus sediminis TaxID=360185 RepID=UPI0009FA6417|nr:YjfB family protein [Amphibacillus sediminis]
MDIARLSMAMSQANVQQQVSLSVMGKTMDQVEMQSDGLIEMLEKSVHPYLGQTIDVQA